MAGFWLAIFICVYKILIYTVSGGCWTRWSSSPRYFILSLWDYRASLAALAPTFTSTMPLAASWMVVVPAGTRPL